MKKDKKKVRCVTRMRVVAAGGPPESFDYTGDGNTCTITARELTLVDTGNGWVISLGDTLDDDVNLTYCQASDLLYAAEFLQRMDNSRGSIGLRYMDASKIYTKVRKYPRRATKGKAK